MGFIFKTNLYFENIKALNLISFHGCGQVYPRGGESVCWLTYTSVCVRAQDITLITATHIAALCVAAGLGTSTLAGLRALVNV